MDACIRFGNERDIFRMADSRFIPAEPSRTVLSFSKRVRNLPDEPEFAQLLDSLELRYEDCGPDKEFEVINGRLVEHGNRLVEIKLPVGRDQIIRLGRSMVGLARRKGRLGSNDVLFIDHTIDPAGRTLQDFEALLATEREDRIRDELRHHFGLNETEIERFFSEFQTQS